MAANNIVQIYNFNIAKPGFTTFRHSHIYSAKLVKPEWEHPFTLSLSTLSSEATAKGTGLAESVYSPNYYVKMVLVKNVCEICLLYVMLYLHDVYRLLM